MQQYNDYYNQEAPDYEPIHPVGFDSNASRQSNIVVTKCILTPTGEYNTQYMRPWVTEFNVDNRNQVAEAIQRTLWEHQTKVQNGVLSGKDEYVISPSLLASTSSAFLQPSETYESAVKLNNMGDWGNQVCRFMMSIEVKHGQSIAPKQYVIIGHTDRMGLTSQGNVDPQMVFTINSMFETRDTAVPTGYGMQMKRTLVSCNQILVNDRYEGPGSLPTAVHRMRPQDVVQSIHIAQIPEINTQNVNVIDSRSTNSTIPAKSTFDNANPNMYMSRILSSLTHGKERAKSLNREHESFDMAASMVAEGSHYRDPFLTAIAGFNMNAGTNKFTFRDLLRLDPNAQRDEVLTIQWRERPTVVGHSAPGQDMHVRGTTNEWNGKDRTTRMAAMISNMMPSLMTSLAVRRCHIFASNKQGMADIFCTGIEGMLPGVDMSDQAKSMEFQVQQQIVNEISFNGETRYEISITADLTGEIWISMDLESSGKTDFVAPAYASALTSPVVTRNVNNLLSLARDFNTLQTEIFPQSSQPVKVSNDYWTGPGASGVQSPYQSSAPAIKPSVLSPQSSGNPYQTIK